MNEHPIQQTRRWIRIGQSSSRAGFLPMARRGLTAAFLAGTLAVGGLMSACTAGPENGDRHGKAAVSDIPAGSFMSAWRAVLPIEQNQVRRLEMNEQSVFAFTTDTRCYWINRGSGRLATAFSVGKPEDSVFAPITIGERVVIPTTRQLMIYQPDGRPLQFTLTGEDKKVYRSNIIPLGRLASSDPAASSDTIFIGQSHPSGGRVGAIELKAKPYALPSAWEVMTRSQVTAAPAYQDGAVFIGSQDGNVYAVRASDATAIWPALDGSAFRTGGPIMANLQADKDGVLVASMDSKLYCLDLNTGRIRWVFHAGYPLTADSTPIMTPQTIYMYVPQAGVAAIDRAEKVVTRKAKWTVSEGRQYLAADENHVYLRTADNGIIGVDRQTGEIRMRSRRNGFAVFATNTVSNDGLIYAATREGVVYAIRPVHRGGMVGEWVMVEQGEQPIRG